jgi:hypothetical protein
VEFSTNGILGRVTGPNRITYPGVFLGLPFDVHMERGTAVYGHDVPIGAQVTITTIEAGTPEQL